MIPIHTLRPLGRLSCIGAFAALGACTTLDPTADLERSRALAAERIGPLPSDLWSASTPLTEDVALATAFDRNTQVRSALQLVAKRRAELNQASLPPNPTIGLGIGIAVDGLSGAPALVQVLEQLSWLWTRPHRMKQADAARRESILAAADVAIVLAAEVRSAHTVALGARHHVTLDEQFAETTEQTTSLVQRLAEVGETSQTEVDLALLDHAQALAAVAASRQNLVASQTRPARSNGRPRRRDRFRCCWFAQATRCGPHRRRRRAAEP